MRNWTPAIVSAIFGGVLLAVTGAPAEVWTYCRVATPGLPVVCVVFEQLKPWND
jgi:hypothetical protein